MKNRWKIDWRTLNSAGMHYLRFAAIPAVAIILTVIIMASNRDSDGKKMSAAVAAQTTESAASGIGSKSDEAAGSDLAETLSENQDGQGQGAGADDENSETASVAAGAESSAEMSPGADEDIYAGIDISQYTLKQDEVPELTALVRTYCQAKEDADPQLMASLYGKSGLTEEEIAEEQARMEIVKASVKSYENISCYSIEGPEPDTYVIFPYFELQYRGTQMLMPQLTWAYVQKTNDGRYVMSQEVSASVAAYITRIGEKDDVLALRTQVADAMAAAIESDTKLKSIYTPESEVVIGRSN